MEALREIEPDWMTYRCSDKDAKPSLQQSKESFMPAKRTQLFFDRLILFPRWLSLEFVHLFLEGKRIQPASKSFLAHSANPLLPDLQV